MCDRETGDAGTERLSSSQSEVCFQTWASQAKLHTRPGHSDDGPSGDLHRRSAGRSGPSPWPPLALTLDVSYEWHHTARGLWRLASLAEWHALKAHPRSSVSKFPSFSRLSNAPLQGQTTCCLFLCSLDDRQSLGVSPLAKVSRAAVDTGVHVPHILCGLPPEPTLPLPAAARGNATAESGPRGAQLSLHPLPALAPAGWAGQAGQELPGLVSRLCRGAEPAGVCLHLGLSVQGGEVWVGTQPRQQSLVLGPRHSGPLWALLLGVTSLSSRTLAGRQAF